ncbi:MAG: hypothetical protein GY873_02565 [Bosea sp.]|uniref:hypothetical protein n=1 Tax=Bosea sp. (in: a-proteobacteria) TaxID=1871050 RepID=UPI0023964CCC|nr:hypothetical protein [Bosea sp. (in: a-proteobacteria)]MCP4733052.1 hypothetical protein [Bosea sp. (in: a-proteobacteria)]
MSSFTRPDRCDDLSSDIAQRLTRHACERSIQRAVPAFLVELLIDFARPVRCGAADRYALDKRGRQEIRSHLGPQRYREIDGKLDCWAVVGDDGKVITIGRRGRGFRSATRSKIRGAAQRRARWLPRTGCDDLTLEDPFRIGQNSAR